MKFARFDGPKTCKFYIEVSEKSQALVIGRRDMKFL